MSKGKDSYYSESVVRYLKDVLTAIVQFDIDWKKSNSATTLIQKEWFEDRLQSHLDQIKRDWCQVVLLMKALEAQAPQYASATRSQFNTAETQVQDRITRMNSYSTKIPKDTVLPVIQYRLYGRNEPSFTPPHPLDVAGPPYYNPPAMEYSEPEFPNPEEPRIQRDTSASGSGGGGGVSGVIAQAQDDIPASTGVAITREIESIVTEKMVPIHAELRNLGSSQKEELNQVSSRILTTLKAVQQQTDLADSNASRLVVVEEALIQQSNAVSGMQSMLGAQQSQLEQLMAHIYNQGNMYKGIVDSIGELQSQVTRNSQYGFSQHSLMNEQTYLILGDLTTSNTSNTDELTTPPTESSSHTKAPAALQHHDAPKEAVTDLHSSSSNVGRSEEGNVTQSSQETTPPLPVSNNQPTNYRRHRGGRHRY